VWKSLPGNGRGRARDTTLVRVQTVPSRFPG
jgi:hypothetical protein